MAGKKIGIAKIWQDIAAYFTGEDHNNALFHLNQKQYDILQHEYTLDQHYEYVYTLQVKGGVAMPTENYHICHLNGSKLSPDDILCVEAKCAAIKDGHYIAPLAPPRP